MGASRAEGADLADVVAGYTGRFGPGRGYRPSAQADRGGVAEGIGLLLDGRFEQARQRLSQLDFTVRTLVDSVSGLRCAEVADLGDDAVTPRGWGRVYVALDSRARWSVQVPHPVADRGTEQLGVCVLRGSPGGVLVLAGAHRRAGRGNAADVAHRQDTVFHAVCAELVRRGLPGIQLHGFAAASVPGYDVVASTAVGEVARPEGQRLADSLCEHGFGVCRAWTRACPLQGRRNVQGRKAAAQHVPFLHLEFGIGLRTDEQLTARVVEAVGRITADWARA